MAKQFRSRSGVARLRPLLALTALAAAILTLCAVAENAGAPAPTTGCDCCYTEQYSGGTDAAHDVREVFRTHRLPYCGPRAPAR
jgi:hypothetical protein